MDIDFSLQEPILSLIQTCITSLSSILFSSFPSSSFPSHSSLIFQLSKLPIYPLLASLLPSFSLPSHSLPSHSLSFSHPPLSHPFLSQPSLSQPPIPAFPLTNSYPSLPSLSLPSLSLLSIPTFPVSPFLPPSLPQLDGTGTHRDMGHCNLVDMQIPGLSIPESRVVSRRQLW
ncbi:hypothetical protein Pcinc_040137 [Petrolisthes cinctipes]|uniref:Uncharacterized protein n=1 Tax=Petrolisthes cinctipes TaxID=88211 RepID=A0AAE1BM54_PETCI|nr:hypothetical protein Pcinc_040137 [Petrolisthes cinctipes]